MTGDVASDPADTHTAVPVDRADAIASEWLRAYGEAIERGDAAGAAALFVADGWWRDLPAFTWDLRAFDRSDAIAAALEGSLRARLGAARTRPGCPPGKRFTPKDKLASRFEGYAAALELNVWTKTAVVGGDYDVHSRDRGHERKPTPTVDPHRLRCEAGDRAVADTATAVTIRFTFVPIP